MARHGPKNHAIKLFLMGGCHPPEPLLFLGGFQPPRPPRGACRPPRPLAQFLRGSASSSPFFLVPRALYQDLGTKILVPRSWYQDPGTKILVPRSWYQDLDSKILVPRAWCQDLGTKIFGETGPCMTGEPPSRPTLTDILSLL